MHGIKNEAGRANYDDFKFKKKLGHGLYKNISAP